MKFLIAILFLSAPAFAAETFSFDCKYDGKKKDEPYYGMRLTLKIKGDDATTYDSKGKKLDSGTLSDRAREFDRPRFFGFQGIADCASGNYMEVDKGMLKGEDGSIEFTGPGNEDCGAGDDKYTCKAK